MGTITRIDPLPETGEPEPSSDAAGLGALRTERGNLPLHRLDLRADITGLSSAIRLTQGFRNTFDVPLEATYIFPLPDRAAVTALSMTVAGRVVQAELQERGAAREAYDAAIAAGQRASIAEEERPDVFTLRVGNILPGEEAVVQLTLAGPLPLVDGQAEFRFPLVVAPRYIPGAALPGPGVGSGWADDTDAVPDASRITPPTLLPGFPNPVELSIEARIDPAGLELAGVASSLHAVAEGEDGALRILPGERLNRDFILRLDYTGAADSLVLVPDADADGEGGAADEGTYQLVVMPPEPAEPGYARPKDLVLLLDRSGSMEGWKMVAARRAAARIVDTLTDADRFSVLLFDHTVEHPDALPEGLVKASDRNRFRAVEHLAKAEARGGTELLEPLRAAAEVLKSAAVAGEKAARDRVIVLVTDGQVGNEDQILAQITGELPGVRVHSVGIDRAVNAGFLGRLAAIGGGRCELVESEDRLDEAMDRIHRRIGSPTVTDLRIEDAEGLSTIPDSSSPSRVSSLFPGVPLVRSGRYKGAASGAMTISGLTVEGEPWTRTVHAVVAPERAEVASIWARGHLRELEDRYTVSGAPDLEREIVRISLRHGVLCRFTAYVAIDAEVATDGATPHPVTQLVEPVEGWAAPEPEPQPDKRRMREMAPAPHIGGQPPTGGGGFGAPATPSPSSAPAGPSGPAPSGKPVPPPPADPSPSPTPSGKPVPPPLATPSPSPTPSGKPVPPPLATPSPSAAPSGKPVPPPPADPSPSADFTSTSASVLSVPPPPAISDSESASALPSPPPSIGGPAAPPPAPMLSPSMPSMAARPSPSFRRASADMAAYAEDSTQAVREQAATEARLLRESAAEPAFRRRDLLDDLASRLDALLLHQRSSGPASAPIVVALQELITLLRDETQPLPDRWDRALTLLDNLATEPAKPEKPAKSEKPTERRGFWKRG